MKFLLSVLAASAALAATSAGAAGLVNGSFEQPGLAGGRFLAPGSTYITGWTTVDATPGGDSDVYIGDDASFGAYGVHPSQGNFYLELTGDVGRGKGVVSDPIAVAAGGQYRLDFDVGAFWVAGYGSFGDATVDVLVNGAFAGSFTVID